MLNVKTFKNSILTAVLVMLTPMVSLARGSSDSSMNSVLQYFNATLMNPDSNYQQQVFMELLGAGGQNLNWPAFPRTWVQKEIENYKETNVSAKLGYNFGDIGFMSKFNIAYKYKRKTTFIAITTTDASLGGVGSNNVTTSPATDPILRRIRYFDTRTQRNYLVTDQEHPMVGFCIFELQAELAKTNDNNVSLMFGEVASGQGEIRRETQAIYSKFFQVEGVSPTNNYSTTGAVPESDYLTVKCDQEFNNMVRAYAEYEFNKIIIEFVGQNHEENQCQTDNDCTNLYNNNSPTVGLFAGNPLSVPGRAARCVQFSTGIKKCQVRSLENRPCALYYQRDGTVSENHQRYKNATNQLNEARCDRGLTCVMDQHADGLLGFMFPNWGSAFCRRQ